MNAEKGGGPARGELTNRVVTRTTLPPSQPQLDGPATFRGQSGDDERKPGYLPPPSISVKPAAPPPPPRVVTPPLPPVRLGLPEFAPATKN
jgi:hypothetical protein